MQEGEEELNCWRTWRPISKATGDALEPLPELPHLLYSPQNTASTECGSCRAETNLESDAVSVVDRPRVPKD